MKTERGGDKETRRRGDKETALPAPLSPTLFLSVSAVKFK